MHCLNCFTLNSEADSFLVNREIIRSQEFGQNEVKLLSQSAYLGGIKADLSDFSSHRPRNDLKGVYKQHPRTSFGFFPIELTLVRWNPKVNF